MDKLISVIVPVYKVEKYLSRCIDSIIAQTYNNLEIILIDDGSPDRSGRICDDYARKDHRIRVFHKPNGGVSSARNLGLKEAKGEYIGFVDSDDYIAPQMYEVLFNNLVNNNADLSVCGYKKEIDKGIFEPYYNKRLNCVFLRNEMLKNLLSNKYYTCSCWNVLFKKYLLSDLFFDEKRKHNEDLLFLYEVMKKCNNLFFTSDAYYYYCTNEGSASLSSFSDSTMDIVYISEYILGDIKANIPELYRFEKKEYMRNNIMCMQLAVPSGYDNKTNLKLIQRNIRKNLFSYLFSSAALGYKYSAVLISISLKLYKLLKP